MATTRTPDLPSPWAAGSVDDWDLTPAEPEPDEKPRRASRATGQVTQRQALGAYGERLAARYLMEQGMALLDRNWTAPTSECVAGEIDLLLRDGSQVVVCEVKTRSTLTSGTPHQAVDEERAARLRMLGEAWLRAHPGLGEREIRVDLVAVLRPRRGTSTVEHVRGIG